jgi:translation initiation factor 1
MAKDWKDRLGIVYSTNPDFRFETENEKDNSIIMPGQQTLRVTIDRKQRKGKSVTLIQGYIGNDNGLKELAKTIKVKCGVGGAAKDGEIIIQGEFIEKVKELLKGLGYKVK